jgi:hypothetical protein
VKDNEDNRKPTPNPFEEGNCANAPDDVPFLGEVGGGFGNRCRFSLIDGYCGVILHSP